MEGDQMVVLRVGALGAAVAALLGAQLLLGACSGDDGDRPGATPRDCRTSTLGPDAGQPASSPRQAVQELLLLPGEAPGEGAVRITDVVELADDRARVGVTIGNWEGGYEVEREADGWVPVATVRCGEQPDCSDIVVPDTDDSYVTVHCPEPSD